MATRHEETKAHEEPVVKEAEAPPPPKPEHPARSGLLGAFRNAGMTADQAEGVVKAFEDYLVAGTKH